MSDIFSIIGSWLVCAIAAERAAEAITVSVVFAPLRQMLAKLALIQLYHKTNPDDTWMSSENTVYRGWIFSLIKMVGRWSSDLVSCGWCTSFWTSAFFSIFLPGGYIVCDAGDNIVVKAIALWGLANLYHAIFRLIHNGRVAAVDVNLRLIGPEIDNSGGTNGEFGEGASQEDSIGVEPPEV
ncbi:MAG: hypothetical protein WC919_04365 [Candidatus Paceibacterota bacterium]|jgi:hypothetical protein